MVEVLQERQTIQREIGAAVRHSLVYGLGSVAVKGLGFLMIPFYTHYLNPADYGILEILDLTISVFGMFLNMGITAALLRSYSAAPSPGQKRKAVSTAFLFVAATGISHFSSFGRGWSARCRICSWGRAVPSKYLLHLTLFLRAQRIS